MVKQRRKGRKKGEVEKDEFEIGEVLGERRERGGVGQMCWVKKERVLEGGRR